MPTVQMTNLCGKGVISQGRPITCPTSVRFRLPHPMSYLSTTESHRTEAPEERGLTSINGPMADLLKPRALSTSRDRASNAEQPRSERTAADLQRHQMETMPRMAASPCMLGQVEVLPAAISKPACKNRLPATMRADFFPGSVQGECARLLSGNAAGSSPALGEYVTDQARRPAGANATGRRQFKKEA